MISRQRQEFCIALRISQLAGLFLVVMSSRRMTAEAQAEPAKPDACAETRAELEAHFSESVRAELATCGPEERRAIAITICAS